MRRLALVAGAGLVAVGLFVLVVHTPPVRRAVLRYVVAEVQRRYGIRIEAARLDYNLPALTVGLSQVRIAAQRTPELPFFQADYVSAALASRALTGIVAFDEIAVTNGHVQLTRDRDGRMNLPDSSDTPAGEPAPLNIAHLSAPRFVIDIKDAQNDLALAIPGLTLDIGRSDGRMTLVAPATLAVGGNRTEVTTLDGGASFDGRALKLTMVTLRSPETSLEIDGVLSLLVKGPSVDVHATGTADVERLARWGIAEGERPRGSIALDVRATGPFASPTADVRATSDSLSVPSGADPSASAEASADRRSAKREGRSGPRVVLTDVALKSHVSTEAANIEEAAFSIAGGRVAASGEIPLGDADAHLKASWHGVDATALTTALAGRVETAPSGTLSGDLSAVGPLAEIARWSADVTLRADGGVTRRGRVAIPGTTRLQLADGRWRIDARHRAGNTVPIALVAGGTLNSADVGRSTLDGRLDISDTNIPPLLRLVRTLGIAEVDEDVVSGGTVSAAVKLGGRLASPTVDADIHGLDLAGMQFSVGELRANASG
ncbi:MAG TPA: hypothetical protein VEP46_12680, partial [Vicinamibacterales bacterium]|nr:hypothetical protein [Vicinamibacterales bacterium]